MTGFHDETFNPRPIKGDRRRRRIGFALGAMVVVVSLAFGLTYRHFTNPERIRRIAVEYLRQYTTAEVTVGSAGVSWFEGVRLFDVTVYRDERLASHTSTARGDRNEVKPESTPVFSCREVRLVADRKSVVLGKPDIKSVVAIEPACTIVRDRTTDRTNLTGLLRVPAGAGRFSGLGPIVELRDARVRVIRREGDRDRLIEDLKLTVRARPSPREADTYDVVWQGGNGHSADGHSKIDLRTGQLRNVQGGLPWMSIEAVMAGLNVHYDGAGAWCDLLGLDGTVRAKDYNLSSGDDRRGERSATIELDDAAISIPVSMDEAALPVDQRYLRFERVDGEIELSAGGLRAQFSGLLHGSRCDVSASLRGGLDKLATLDDVDFDARIVARDLQLPRCEPGSPAEEVRFVNQWPRLQRFYRDYDPHGLVDLDVSVSKRAGSDEPVVIRRITLSPKGGDMSARFIPYRLVNVYGMVEYTPDGVFIRDLQGEHGGGSVSISGHLDEPNRWSAKQLIITGTSISIDEALYGAMPPRFREAARQFDGRGLVDLDLQLSQPAGTEVALARWQSTITVLLRDVSARYAGFPYPIDDITGTLTVAQRTLEVSGVAGRTGRASISVDGKIDFSDDGVEHVDLAISGTSVAVDSALLNALSPSLRKRIESLHPRGVIDVRSNLSMNEGSGSLEHETDLKLRNVAIRPERMPIQFVDIVGGIKISGDSIEFKNVRGKYRDADVMLDGFVAGPGSDVVKLTVRSRDIVPDQTLRAALPERLRHFLTDVSVDGAIGTETVVSSKASNEAGSFDVRTKVLLRGVELQLAGFPAPFRRVVGDLVLDDRGARTTDLEAMYGPIKVRAAMDIGRSADGAPFESGELSLVATGAILDDTFRALLPHGAVKHWDKFDPSGSVDVHIDSASFERYGVDAPREWTVDGYIEFNDVALRGGGTEVNRMSGTIMGSGRLYDQREGTILTGSMALSSVEILGQPLERAESDWSYARVADGEGVLSLDTFRGSIHNGSLTGRVRLGFDPSRTEYSVATTVHGMQIEPFVHRIHAPPVPTPAPIAARGLMDGQLSLSGTFGEPSRKRGRGRCEIRDGRMYRLPLILAIVQVLNLAVPDAEAFDDVKADFFVVGNRVQFKDIVLRNSALALVGSGTMTIPDRGVDLDLINVNPHRWSRVPVLAEFIEGASRELMELHVTGPLSRPTVRARPLPAFSDEIEQLFEKRLTRKGRTAAR